MNRFAYKVMGARMNCNHGVLSPRAVDVCMWEFTELDWLIEWFSCMVIYITMSFLEYDEEREESRRKDV